MSCKHDCANCTCTATGCANYPGCGCDDPFKANWPSCIPTGPAKTADTVRIIVVNLDQPPAPDHAAHLDGACQFYPECGCGDASKCPMH